MRLLAILFIVFGVASGSSAAAQDAAALWTVLRAGGHVALLRHAATVGGAGDPPGFRLDDCATQRNLTDKGRAEARRLGERFRAEAVPIGKVLSSQWCRCRETVALMELGTPEIAPTFNNAFTFRDRVDQLTAGAREIVAAWKGPGTLVVVTHGANILPLTGVMPEEGAVVVVKADPASAAKLRVLGRITSQPSKGD
jgi:broad specificity phosphatase PhoE